MYIPDFWCGVGAALLFEIILIVGVAIWNRGKGK